MCCKLLPQLSFNAATLLKFRSKQRILRAHPVAWAQLLNFYCLIITFNRLPYTYPASNLLKVCMLADWYLTRGGYEIAHIIIPQPHPECQTFAIAALLLSALVPPPINVWYISIPEVNSQGFRTARNVL